MTNFVNNIPDMQQRLIDANALELRIMLATSQQEDIYEIARTMFELIESATTVETMDDVMKRLPVDTELDKRYRDEYRAICNDYQKAQYAKTALEAVTRLEAALRA